MHAIMSVRPHPGGLFAFARHPRIGRRGHSSVSTFAGRASLPRRETNSLNFTFCSQRVAAAAAHRELPEEPITGNATPGQQPDEGMEVEDEFDMRMDALFSYVDTAAAMPGTGFVAVHLAALCGPRLLDRISAVLREARAVFKSADGAIDIYDYDGLITREGFDEIYQKLAVPVGADVGSPQLPIPYHASTVITDFDDRYVIFMDYVKWCRRVEPRHLPFLAEQLQRLSDEEELQRLSDEEDEPDSPWFATRRFRISNRASLIFTPSQQQQLERLQSGLQQLVERAAKKGVKLLFEADSRIESYLVWPAVEYLAYRLMPKKENLYDIDTKMEAVVFLSYGSAAFRDVADMPQRLRAEVSRAPWEGHTPGIKLVDDPGVNDASYIKCVKIMLSAVEQQRVELMVDSHSPAAMTAAVARMARMGLDPAKAPVYFQHPLGVADSLSSALANEGYKVYKYCPFGDMNKAKLQDKKRHVLSLVQAELWPRGLEERVLGMLKQLLQVRELAMKEMNLRDTTEM